MTQLFQPLDPATLAGLRDSIGRLGVLVPVAQDQHGNMLDGHHRKAVADDLGVTYRVDTIQVSDEGQATEIRRTLNVDRRHLSGEDLRRHIVLLAELRRPDGVGALSQNEIADRAGVSQQYIGQVLGDPEVTSTSNLPDERQGRDGKVYKASRPAVVTAKDETEAVKAQAALALIPAHVELPASFTAKEATRTAARERVPESVSGPIAPPAGKFSCIVIDPPWPMQKIERDERPDQGVALDYPVMSLDDIADETHVPVRTLAADDCHIYLWVTHKFLPAGLDLLRAWDFNYQCVMTWRKNVGITPFSWMYDTEHVLFGRRGNLPLTRLGLRLSFEAPVQGHSRKPGVFYDRVISASPGPRVEMFARTGRDGFTSWGNEVADGVR